MIEPERFKEISSRLAHFSIGLFLFRSPSFIRKKWPFPNYKHILIDQSIGGKDTYYIDKVLHPLRLEDVALERSSRPSTGIGLLMYALHYGASEVYLAGVDLDGKPRISDNEGENPHKYETHYAGMHQGIDHTLARIVSERYQNVFVISENSPLHKHFPSKKW